MSAVIGERVVLCFTAFIAWDTEHWSCIFILRDHAGFFAL